MAACCRIIREALRDFGSKVIALKPVVKSYAKLLEHSDKSVREEAKLLAVELFRWIGNALKPSLSNIKPVQVTLQVVVFTAMSNALNSGSARGPPPTSMAYLKVLS